MTVSVTAPVLTPVSYQAFVEDVIALSALLGADDAWRPNFVVGIGRGGLVPAAYLSHASGLPMLSIDHSAQVPDFAAELVIKLAMRTQAGEQLLFVDDINDSGGTIEGLRAALAEAGAVAPRVRFAVLIDNVSSRAKVDYRARTIDRTTTKDWFVFPWEAVAPTHDVIGDALSEPTRLR